VKSLSAQLRMFARRFRATELAVHDCDSMDIGVELETTDRRVSTAEEVRPHTSLTLRPHQAPFPESAIPMSSRGRGSLYLKANHEPSA
jgi:hypothetical protein